MNLNDFKHPAARQVDEMILAGASANEMVPVIADVRLSDLNRFCNDCVFFARLFQLDYVKSFAAAKGLGALTGCLTSVPREMLRDLWFQIGPLLCADEFFWKFVSEHQNQSESKRSRKTQQFDEKVMKRLQDGRPSKGFGWAFDLIGDRASDGVGILTNSCWRSRIFQLDVFMSVSSDNAWLMLQVLPKIPEGIRGLLAKQAFLGNLEDDSGRLDELKKQLWNLGVDLDRGEPPFLDSCIGRMLPSTECFLADVLPRTSKSGSEVMRFCQRDSVEEFEIGLTLMGRKVGLDDVVQFVRLGTPRLLQHYLRRVTSELTPELIDAMVGVVVREWSPANASIALAAIEEIAPGRLRNMHSENGKNLLLYYEAQTAINSVRPDRRGFPDVLVSLGCDPDEKCLMGYSWNDVQRWEGKKCASR